MQRREQLGFGIFGWIWCVIFALSLIPSVGVSWCYSPGTSSAKKRLRYSRTFRRECLQKGRGNKCIFQQGRAVRSESTQFFRPYANTFGICFSYLCIPFNLEKTIQCQKLGKEHPVCALMQKIYLILYFDVLYSYHMFIICV